METYNTWSGNGRGPERWPSVGTTVRLTNYTRGNVLNGDQAGRFRQVVGEVIESPDSGSGYLVIAVGRWEFGEVTSLVYDADHSERWSLTPNRVSLHRGEFTEWQITHVLAAPGPGETEERARQSRAEEAAMQALRERYPDEFTALVAIELAPEDGPESMTSAVLCPGKVTGNNGTQWPCIKAEGHNGQHENGRA